MIKEMTRSWAIGKLEAISNEQRALQNEIGNGVYPCGSAGYDFALLRMELLSIKNSVILAIIGEG